MRRSKGEGSVYKRKDGSWCAQYHDGKKRRYIYGKKKTAVTDRLRKALSAVEARDVVEMEPMTMNDYRLCPRSLMGGTSDPPWGYPARRQ